MREPVVRTINTGFSSEVHHGVSGEYPIQRRPVTDIGLLEGVTRAVGHLGHIEKPSAPAAHRFILRVWRRLMMQTARRAGDGRERLLPPYDILVDPKLGKPLAVPRLAEPAPRVTMAMWPQKYNFGKP